MRPYRLPESFQTERFFLRRVVPADGEAVFRNYATDKEVTRYLSWQPHRHLNETKRYLEQAAQQWNDGTGFPLAVFDPAAADALIGMFHPRRNGSTVSYGYVLRPDSWGKGCATEILIWLVEHALGHPAIHRTQAFCDFENAASARVMEKAGMTYEGMLRRYVHHPNISDIPRDCMMYSKVR